MLTFGGINVSQISGPTSFCVLKPTKKFLEFTQDPNIPIQILLGDKHYSFINACDPLTESYIKQTNSVILSTFQQNWFNLIDSTCTSSSPIDYYIESFIPFKIFKSIDELSHDRSNEEEYLQEGKIALKIKPSVMTYIAQHHLPCFTNTQTKIKLEQCFTRNIRYHLTDVRWSKEYIHIFGESNPSIKMYYESELFTKLSNCCFDFERKDAALPKFREACKNPSKFIELFFNFEDEYIKNHSIVWKQIKKQFTVFHLQQSPIKWFEFIKEYHKFVMHNMAIQNIEEFSLNQKEAIECIDEYDRNQNMYHMYATGMYVKCEEFVSNEKKKYQKFVDTMIFYLTLPLIDIYYLLRSWKCTNNPRQWCNVFNAGNLHTLFIREFLLKTKLFECILEPQGDVYNKSLDVRCLSFDKFYNLDQYIPRGLPIDTKERLPVVSLWLYWNFLNGSKMKKESAIKFAEIQKIDPKVFVKMFERFLM